MLLMMMDLLLLLKGLVLLMVVLLLLLLLLILMLVLMLLLLLVILLMRMLLLGVLHGATLPHITHLPPLLLLLLRSCKPAVAHSLLSCIPKVVVQLHKPDDQLSSSRGQLIPQAGTPPPQPEPTVARVAEYFGRAVAREGRSAHEHHVQHAPAGEPEQAHG